MTFASGVFLKDTETGVRSFFSISISCSLRCRCAHGEPPAAGAGKLLPFPRIGELVGIVAVRDGRFIDFIHRLHKSFLPLLIHPAFVFPLGKFHIAIDLLDERVPRGQFPPPASRPPPPPESDPGP